MSEEKVLYRTQVRRGSLEGYGEGIVTNERLIFRWRDGELTQLPFNHIRSIEYFPIGVGMFRKAVNPALKIVLANSSEQVMYSPEAEEFVSQAQRAIMPF